MVVSGQWQTQPGLWTLLQVVLRPHLALRSRAPPAGRRQRAGGFPDQGQREAWRRLRALWYALHGRGPIPARACAETPAPGCPAPEPPKAPPTLAGVPGSWVFSLHGPGAGPRAWCPLAPPACELLRGGGSRAPLLCPCSASSAGPAGRTALQDLAAGWPATPPRGRVLPQPVRARGAPQGPWPGPRPEADHTLPQGRVHHHCPAGAPPTCRPLASMTQGGGPS